MEEKPLNRDPYRKSFKTHIERAKNDGYQRETSNSSDYVADRRKEHAYPDQIKNSKVF